MNTQLVEEIAAAVLYEGYLLYPYRASAIKNRQRWNFGVLFPRAYAEQQSGADACRMRTECLVKASPEASPTLRVRFLHLIAQVADGRMWQGAMEREIALPRLSLSELISCTPCQRVEIAPAENQQPLEVTVEAGIERLRQDLFKIGITILNTGDFNGSNRDQALMQSLVSTHTILGIDHGEFISLLDPPEGFRHAVEACENLGTWPVLVGEEGERDAMLSSPIILYDYPKIAAESSGALFDGTEIDEILSLRILTLTDEEKLAMGQTDERARQILQRTESMPPEQFMKMHGVMHSLHRENK